MNVIAMSTMRAFWENLKVKEERKKAERALRGWERVVRRMTWLTFADVRETYPSADQVGTCVVFNIGGNEYRLIAWVRYRSQTVFVKKVMTHREYDRTNWQRECGCDQEPGSS